MAPSTTAVVPSSPQERSTATRSTSPASIASTGGASLRRRSRTRTRTLTSGKRGKSLGPIATSKDGVEDPAASPYDGLAPPGPLVDEPQEIDAVSHFAPRRTKPARMEPRSIFVAHVSDNDVPAGKDRSWPSVMGEPSRGRQTKSDSGSLRMSKARLRGASVPRQAFRSNVSSDSSAQASPLTPDKTFAELPPVRVVGERFGNHRDSIVSSTSSLYPASTTSDSLTESSLLPYSSDDADGEHSFAPEIVQPGNPDFDADDVSYRLRLLVNNNYFLPPAHAKPSPLSLAPHLAECKKTSVKSSNATFLDFFRIGKAKSRPTTPCRSNFDPPTKPALRTTSDATTVSGYVPHHTQSLPQTPVHVLPHQTSMNRVVVVRERMDNLTTAAKEAEQDLKTRDARRTKSQHSHSRNNFVDDVIDPTDAVDLPPRLESSLFAVQASAAFGLGIQDSIGAALLAEHLPPPNSPGIWSLSTGGDSWRKDLLHEAVSHSFNNSMDTSFASSGYQSALHSPPVPSTSSGPSVPRSSSHTSPPASPSSPKHRIGQRIMDDETIAAELEMAEHEDPVTPTMSKIPLNVSPIVPKSLLESDRSSWTWQPPLLPPGRAETPSETIHPLAPAPRKLVNPLYSLSQPDLSDANTRERDVSMESSLDTSQVVRRVVSSPRLSAVHDLIMTTQRAALSITPPPSSFHRMRSAQSSPAMHTLRETPSFSSYLSMTSEPRYSDDQLSYATPMDTDVEQSGPRPSVSASLVSESRPSLSELSAQSPTASAFQDALFGSCRSPSVLSRRSYTTESISPTWPSSPPPPANAPAVGPAPRSIAVSPPPRVSSSLGPRTLPPPPRSPAIKPLYRPSVSSHASPEPSRRSLASTAHSRSSEAFREESMSDEMFIPPVPTIPLTDRRGHPSISLCIPFGSITPSLRSAPDAASATAFFDSIQAQPNAMDDLDTSDESGSDEEYDSPQASAAAAVLPEPRTPTTTSSMRISSSSSRPSFMRLGNYSTPHIAHSRSPADLSPAESDPRRPIANVPDLPPRGHFFSARKKGLGHANSPLLPFRPATAQQAQASGSSAITRSSSMRRPATAQSAQESSHWQRESLQKFDGMLLQHMEAERDRFKQIASNISSSKS